MESALPSASLGVTLMTCLVGLAVLCVLGYGLLGRKEPWDLLGGVGLLTRIRKRRERLLRAIKDLELERESGGLAEEEFVALRKDFKSRAVEVTRDLERVRRARLRSLARKRRGLTPSQKKHVEELVRQRLERRTAAAVPSSSGEKGETP